MIVKCKAGGEMVDVPEGQDPHTALDLAGCPHCADKHGTDVHCGEAASGCPRTHKGPCWSPPDVPDRPKGCTVCRPLLFMGNATFELTGA